MDTGNYHHGYLLIGDVYLEVQLPSYPSYQSYLSAHSGVIESELFGALSVA